MKNFRITVLLFLACIFSTLFGINVKAIENSPIESGIYEVENDVYHSSEIGMSMSRTYLNNIMSIESRNNEMFCTVEFSGSEYMQNYKMIIDGNNVESEIVDRNNEKNTVKVKFKINSIDSKINANMYVIPMGRDVSFDIIPKKDTLKLIEKIEEPKSDIIKKEDKGEVDKLEDNYNNSIPLIIAGGIVVILVTIIIVKNKFNKK
ncbi:hypothetical protein JCM1393_29080 [Clostridium carnis]